MDNSEIETIILKIYEEQKKTNKQMGEMKDGLQKQINGLQKQVDQMQVLVNKIPRIEEEVDKISKRVAVIEKENGEKLKILLDVVTGNSEKNKELEKRIQKDEKIINRHSDEIYYLKEKVQSA